MRNWSICLIVAALMAPIADAPARAADVICYNCPPQWADFATMLKSITLGPFINKAALLPVEPA
jgi:putative spermidine/putrescine transport system substrate-binding protein